MKWLVKDDFQKESFSDSLEIGKIIKNIDKKYVIGPRVLNCLKEYDPHKIQFRKGKNVLGNECNGHPNKDEHKIIAKFIKEKFVDVYS